ncbi:hypothetical protein K504DRAFT_500515 [Pleomassaria siparia CBS 279.74]|uniref:Uncharacterized protein n=1 Tax=Pleomassaria siparia CBS 279.74 TaxID=1314801 RepID=A0A6G1KH50_9PLEO|nr:hypothetical protein K504DRAFT_500515 [Pleomassaria siparia CBS 279.74]
MATTVIAAVPSTSPANAVIGTPTDAPHALGVCEDCQTWFTNCMGFWCKVFNPNCYAQCQQDTCRDHPECAPSRNDCVPKFDYCT